MQKLLLIYFGGLLAATGWAASNYPPLTVSELLDKFAAAQEPLKSFIAWEEGSSTGTDGENFWAIENCMDWPHLIGGRSRVWGARRGNTGQVFTKNQPDYRSILKDLRVCMYYKRYADAGEVTVMPEVLHPKVMAEAIIYGSSGWSFGGLRHCLGVLAGDRFDLDIRDAPSVRVRAKLEPAGWVPSPCYAIEAETKYCLYIAWLDPAHDYQLAKAVRQIRQDHLRPNGQPHEPGERSLLQLDKVRFEQRDGHWLPVESAVSGEWVFANAVSRRLETQRITAHSRLTRFLLNPDHVALRSFAANDIRDGAKVTVDGEYRNPRTARHGTWQKGRVVDAARNVLWTPESLGGRATKQPPQSGRTSGTDKPAPAGKK